MMLLVSECNEFFSSLKIQRNLNVIRVLLVLEFIFICCFTQIFSIFAANAADNTQNHDTQHEASSLPLNARKFGDWTLRCASRTAQETGTSVAPATPDQCEIAQSLMAVENGKTVQLVQLAVTPAKDKAGKVDWALIALTPLDVLVAADFGLGVDQQKPVTWRYRNCNQMGCFVIIPLEQKLLSSLKRGNKGFAYFRLLNAQTVKVVFPLAGFTKAFEVLAAGKGLPRPEPSNVLNDGSKGKK